MKESLGNSSTVHYVEQEVLIHDNTRTRAAFIYSSVWASYQIRKIAGCACAGNAGNVFPRRRFQRKPVVNDPGMHHGTCVTHVPWCMSGSLTCGDGENVPGIPGACAPAISRIWKEAHDIVTYILLADTNGYTVPVGIGCYYLKHIHYSSRCWDYWYSI